MKNKPTAQPQNAIMHNGLLPGVYKITWKFLSPFFTDTHKLLMGCVNRGNVCAEFVAELMYLEHKLASI